MAEKFLSLVPQHDMIKFGKNGSLVITAAVKLARAKTGRKLIAFPSDHPFYSYDDWFIGKTPCDAGIPEENKLLSVSFKGCDLTSLKALFEKYPNEIACVISEPERSTCYNCSCSMKPSEFLHKAIELCHQYGTLFIQDEMITGFKSHFPGTISKYNTSPDMATWGKGIANGFSFCALTGKKEIMEYGGIKRTGEPKVFLVSTTHGGETHAIAAGLATIEVFENEPVIEHNHKIGDYFINGVNQIVSSRNLQKHLQLTGFNWSVGLAVKNAKGEPDMFLRTLFMQEMIRRGILYQGILSPCYSHTIDDIDWMLSAFDESCEVLQRGIDEGYEKYLVGDEIKPVFRKYN